MTPNGSGSGAGGNANLYGSSFMPMPAACTIQALQVSTLLKSGATTSLTVTLFKNGSAATPNTLTCSLTTSSSTTTPTQCSDTTPGHFVSLVAGDPSLSRLFRAAPPPFYFIGYSMQCK